ncbi:MAG: ZPR1 zinc finger domain-containing protein [Candidatus Diapherotrites archaeon]|nr:ZPR1 zinc finger domain-containing protein [Candidatus Diapherotrites archaeon]
MSANLFTQCPQCGGKASSVQIAKKIPLFGEALFTTITCGKCGFRLSDVFSVETHAPKKFWVEISSAGQIPTKIVRSSSATIRIPELGLSLEPGPMSEGFVSNAEGVLERFRGAVESAKNSSGNPKTKANAQKLLEKIALAENGKLTFTIELLDPFGNSALLGKHVKSGRLSEKELKGLKTGLGA